MRRKARAIVIPPNTVLLAQASIVGEGFMGVNFIEDFANVGNKEERIKFPGVLGSMAPEVIPPHRFGEPGYRFPSKGHGWHNDPYRHSLAARGMKTTTRTNPFPSRHQYPFSERGGWIEFYVGGKEIGRTDIAFHYKDTKYPFGYVVPAFTALSSSLEIYENRHRGHGIGREIIEHIENTAEENGMARVWFINVRNIGFVEKMGYKYTGIGSIYEKVL